VAGNGEVLVAAALGQAAVRVQLGLVVKGQLIFNGFTSQQEISAPS
jgi:hypothetical protein